jgi:hypothetical protein
MAPDCVAVVPLQNVARPRWESPARKAFSPAAPSVPSAPSPPIPAAIRHRRSTIPADPSKRAAMLLAPRAASAARRSKFSIVIPDVSWFTVIAGPLFGRTLARELAEGIQVLQLNPP